MFAIELIVTGVLRRGEATETKPWKPTAYLPKRAEVVEEEVIREEPQPVIESYVQVQVRQCQDDDDPGEIAEGWFSVDGRTVTVTAANGKYVGSRVMLKGEDARVVAKRLLREKTPEGESFNRRLDYPMRGWA